jgi:hypothetical protein
MDSRRPGDEVSLAYHSLVSLILQEELRDYPADDPGPLRVKEKNKAPCEDGASIFQSSASLFILHL